MIEILKAVVLGVVEGVTEFLPISSTGHLILVNQWISFSDPLTAVFDIVIQFGAILAVVVYFWRTLWPFGEKQMVVLDIWKKNIVGVLPALVLGFLFGKIIQAQLFEPLVVAGALIIGGFVLLFVEWQKPRESIFSISEISYGTAFLIGLAQTLAMIPGTSRSAVTIIGGLLLGLSRVTAAEFSFFLAIPTMAAASGYALLKSSIHLGSSEIIILLVGFLTAFLTALVVIKGFIGYLQKHDFRSFGYYRIILGLLIFVYFLAR